MIYIICDENTSFEHIEEILISLYPEYHCNHDILESSIEKKIKVTSSLVSIPLPHEGYDIFLCDNVTSTQDLAKSLYMHGVFKSYGMLLSVTQSKARGQYGHEWMSYKGNVHATLCLPFLACYESPQTTVLLGALLAHFLRTLGVPAYNKWVNDIILMNKKIAGILLEQENECILLGIGINIYTAPQVYNGLHEATAIISHCFFPYSATACMYAFREFLLMKENAFIQFSKKEAKAYIEQYLAHKGKKIGIEGCEKEIQYGVFCGIGDDGALLLSQNTDIVEYMQGRIVCVY